MGNKSKAQKPGYKTRTSKKRSWIVDIPIWCCIYFIVIGMVLGYVFINVTWRERALIEQSEAIPVTATYDSHIVRTSARSGSVSEVEVRFDDFEKCYIPGACVWEENETALKTLQSGEKVQLLLHPNSGDIWEMKREGNTILSFSDARQRMRTDNIGLTVLGGIVGYLIAITGAVSLILQWREHRKEKQQGQRR